MKKLMVKIKKPLTEKEIQFYKEQYLNHVNDIIDYCLCIPETHYSERDRLELLAFSMLSAIDGESIDYCNGFMLVPLIEEDNKWLEYGTNIRDYDIAGSLHDTFAAKMRRND